MQARLLDPTPQVTTLPSSSVTRLAPSLICVSVFLVFFRKDYAVHEIMKHAHGDGAMQVLGKRKLDALGIFRGESGVANSEERLSRMKSRLELANSIAEIE